MCALAQYRLGTIVESEPHLSLQCNNIISDLLNLRQEIVDDWLLLKQDSLWCYDADNHRLASVKFILRLGVGTQTSRIRKLLSPLE